MQLGRTLDKAYLNDRHMSIIVINKKLREVTFLNSTI